MKVLAITLVLISTMLVGCSGEPAGSGATSATSSGSRSATTEVPGGESTRSDNTTVAASGLPTVTINASSGEKVKVRVEIVDSFLGRFMGLRGRKRLAEDRGMLFVYPDEEPRSFTMEDTLIPLSIAFMDSEGRIIDIQDMKPLDDEPPGYDSAQPAQYALEVNQGFFEERGVEVGDRANLPV